MNVKLYDGFFLENHQPLLISTRYYVPMISSSSLSHAVCPNESKSDFENPCNTFRKAMFFYGAAKLISIARVAICDKN